jgi:hypothetical protein
MRGIIKASHHGICRKFCCWVASGGLGCERFVYPKLPESIVAITYPLGLAVIFAGVDLKEYLLKEGGITDEFTFCGRSGCGNKGNELLMLAVMADFFLLFRKKRK